MTGHCQVDFYVLTSDALRDSDVACKLAMKAWERGHRISVLADGDAQARQLDQGMWCQPSGRFLPHGLAGTPDGEAAPVTIHGKGAPANADVLINLRDEPVGDLASCSRLLEFVPHDAERRARSRDKFKAYRDQGIEPATHTLST